MDDLVRVTPRGKHTEGHPSFPVTLFRLDIEGVDGGRKSASIGFGRDALDAKLRQGHAFSPTNSRSIGWVRVSFRTSHTGSFWQPNGKYSEHFLEKIVTRAKDLDGNESPVRAAFSLFSLLTQGFYGLSVRGARGMVKGKVLSPAT
jgi:hypothetical protein